MKIRFINPVPIELQTLDTYIGKDGKILVDKYKYTFTVGNIREVEHVAIDGEGTYEIKFRGNMKGIASQVPQIWIEVMTGDRVQPMPPEKCCPEQPKQSAALKEAEKVLANANANVQVDPKEIIKPNESTAAKPAEPIKSIVPPANGGTPTGPKSPEIVPEKKLP